MIISEDTKLVVEFMQAYSDNSIRKPADIEVLLEASAASMNSQLMNELIFTGKSVRNLHLKIKKSQNTESLIETEFFKHIDRMKSIISSIIPSDDSEINKRFETTYLNDSRGAVLNLIDLAHDLTILKNIQSDSRSGKLNTED